MMYQAKDIEVHPSCAKSFDMILVLTPLAIEIRPLRENLGEIVRTERVGEFEMTTHANGVACAIGGHGKVRFALATQFLVRELKPSLVICAGACGALDPSLETGDIVLAEKTIEHDFNLKFVQRPPPEFAGDEATLLRLRGPDLKFGIIASGDEDIVDKSRARELREKTGALAVAWEGAGLARAAEFCGVPHVEIRAVTDAADEHATKHFKDNVEAGMARIARIISGLADS
jgi:adenosylhomocysteine nucleosidase